MLFNMVSMKSLLPYGCVVFFEQHANLNEKRGGRLSVKGN